MAGWNKIRFFVLFMIFSADALDVIFSRALEDYKQKSKINSYTKDGEKIYCDTLDPLIYLPEPDTSKVIVYIVDKSRFVEIVRNAVRGTISQIGEELKEWHCELVFLGIDNFDDDEYHLISAFMVSKIRPQNKDHPNFTIETIGENHFDRIYQCHVWQMEKYQENAQICGGYLQARLRDIPRGALRPVGSNGKEIRAYGYHPKMGEITWPVSVINRTYFPEVDVMNPKYNFRMRYKTKKICLLILGGKEYGAVTNYKNRIAQKVEVAVILDAMTSNNEALIVVGVFNFDWTEIDIVTQIILEHSQRCPSPFYNVFTYGYGMFNTVYLNVNEPDGRIIWPQPKSCSTDLIKVLMGEGVKHRSIIMFYFDDDEWKYSEIPIHLGNGRYLATGEIINFTFPWINRKIIFIVYDSTEKNDPIDFTMLHQSMEELKRSGIRVVMIEAINFGLHDMHVIAEWIDYHRGAHIQDSDRFIDAEQIAVLGAGIFDTIFQSELTTYNTFLNTKKTELEDIRYMFVNRGNAKRISVAKFEYSRCGDSEFQVRTYPMNTVNGFYEPDLIPDKNLFDTTDEKRIFFIITSGNVFGLIFGINNLNEKASAFRRNINKHYPNTKWSIFLVGLDNFGDRDRHLFAELVKTQTRDERSLEKIVRVLNYGISTALYQYRDNAPFEFENNDSIMYARFTFYFE